MRENTDQKNSEYGHFLRSVNVQNMLINGQIGIVKHHEIIDNNVSIIYVKFNDPNAGTKLVTTNNIGRINKSWVPIKRCEASICIRKSTKASAIKRTQFPLRLPWACTIYKVQGLSFP